tara:strand:- start:29 stop:244 length:216 start_codon:yes stop_codon:yes gene_type:complete
MQTLTSNLNPDIVNSLIHSSNINFDTVSTDMIFSIDNMEELEQLLADLGTGFTDLDSSTLDAERMAELFIV